MFAEVEKLMLEECVGRVKSYTDLYVLGFMVGWWPIFVPYWWEHRLWLSSSAKPSFFGRVSQCRKPGKIVEEDCPKSSCPLALWDHLHRNQANKWQQTTCAMIKTDNIFAAIHCDVKNFHDLWYLGMSLLKYHIFRMTFWASPGKSHARFVPWPSAETTVLYLQGPAVPGVPGVWRGAVSDMGTMVPWEAIPGLRGNHWETHFWRGGYCWGNFMSI